MNNKSGDKAEVFVDKYASTTSGTKAGAIDLSNTGDKLQGMMGLSSHLQKLKEEEVKNRPPTRWERKMNRIFGEAAEIRKNFFMGFMMGGCVGCLMGGLTGTYFAMQYRQFSLIPIMALTSGGSFGFFMGIGAIMRAG